MLRANAMEAACATGDVGRVIQLRGDAVAHEGAELAACAGHFKVIEALDPCGVTQDAVAVCAARNHRADILAWAAKRLYCPIQRERVRHAAICAAWETGDMLWAEQCSTILSGSWLSRLGCWWTSKPRDLDGPRIVAACSAGVCSAMRTLVELALNRNLADTNQVWEAVWNGCVIAAERGHVVLVRYAFSRWIRARGACDLTHDPAVRIRYPAPWHLLAHVWRASLLGGRPRVLRWAMRRRALPQGDALAIAVRRVLNFPLRLAIERAPAVRWRPFGREADVAVCIVLALTDIEKFRHRWLHPETLRSILCECFHGPQHRKRGGTTGHVCAAAQPLSCRVDARLGRSQNKASFIFRVADS